MSSLTIVTARTLVVLSVVTVLPVLAIPHVNAWLNGWLHGESREETGSRVVDTASFDTASVEDVTVDEVAVVLPITAARVSSSERPATAGPSTVGPSSVGPSSDTSWEPQRTAEIQESLKGLGARYMVLERLPQSGFRFRCEVDATERGVYARGFEAVDANPQQAMEKVLAEVSAWSASRQGHERTASEIRASERR